MACLGQYHLPVMSLMPVGRWRTVFNCLSRVVYTVAGDLSNRCYNAISKMMKVYTTWKRNPCALHPLSSMSQTSFLFEPFCVWWPVQSYTTKCLNEKRDRLPFWFDCSRWQFETNMIWHICIMWNPRSSYCTLPLASPYSLSSTRNILF